MITIWLEPQTTHLHYPGGVYRVAGRTLVTDVSLAALLAFEARDPVPHKRSAWLESPAEPGWQLVYRGPGWIGAGWRTVECRSGPDGYRVAVDDGGNYWIAADGSAIARLAIDAGAPEHIVTETILGPALILALALRGVFCLHASALVHGDQALAFPGESESGKSTLALQISKTGGLAWRRLADDVLPIALSPDGPVALPRFPQLKLPPASQPGGDFPERLPLAAVYALDAPRTSGRRTLASGHDKDCQEADGGIDVAEDDSTHAAGDPSAPGDVALRRIGAREAMLTLVRHTVAARLFDADLSARHMAFCAAVADALPVRHLGYPHRLGVLPHVRKASAADLRA